MSNFPSLIALMMAAAGAGAALSPAPEGTDFAVSAMTSAPVKIAPAASLAGTLTIDRDSDGFFYMPAMVNGSSVRFLVDTGANMVILPGHVAAKAGISGTGTAVAATVGGPQSVELASIQSLNAAGITLHNVPVAIQHSAMATPLLGMDTLAQMGRIEIDGNRLSIKPATP